MTDVTIPDSIPGDPTVQGEANQIIWDASSIYTYYNGTWGRSPRTVDHWNDLEGDVRFVLCNKEQLLTQEQKQIACKNLGILPATTERFGIVRYTDNWQDTGSGDPGFWPVTLTRTAIIELCKHQFEEYVYTMDVDIYEKCAEVYDFTVQAAELACTAADAAEGFASDARECVINAPDITANNTFTASNTFNGPTVLNGPVAGQGIDTYSDEYCTMKDVWIGRRPSTDELSHAMIYAMQVSERIPMPYALAHTISNVPIGMRVKKILIPVYKGDRPSNVKSRHGFIYGNPTFQPDPRYIPEQECLFLSDVETSYYDDDYDEFGLKWVECVCKQPEGYVELYPDLSAPGTIENLEDLAYPYRPEPSRGLPLLYIRGIGENNYNIQSYYGMTDVHVFPGSCMAQFEGLSIGATQFCLYTARMYPGKPAYTAPILVYGDLPSKSVCSSGFDIAQRHQKDPDVHVTTFNKAAWNVATDLAHDLDDRLSLFEEPIIEELNAGTVLSADCTDTPASYNHIYVYRTPVHSADQEQLAYHEQTARFASIEEEVDILNAADTMAGFTFSIVDGIIVATSETYYSPLDYTLSILFSYDSQYSNRFYFNSNATVLKNSHKYKYTANGASGELKDITIEDNATATLYITIPDGVPGVHVPTDWLNEECNPTNIGVEDAGYIQAYMGPGLYVIQVQSIKVSPTDSIVYYAYKQYLRNDCRPLSLAPYISNTIGRYTYNAVSGKAVYDAIQNIPSNDTITALEARIAALEANGSTEQETRPRAILVYFVDTMSNNIVPYPPEALEQLNEAVRTYPMTDNNGHWYYSAAIPMGDDAIFVIAYSRDAWTDNDFGLFGWGPFVERYSGPTADILCTARFFEIY